VIQVRVASVPASHVYVRHLGDPGGRDTVSRLADPVPKDGAKVPGGWWPPLMLDPQWISDNHDQFDVFHVHFGFDAIDEDSLQNVVNELKFHRKPLVYTVHDLRNPHQRDPDIHARHQDVLVCAADELVTLTQGAAEAVHTRWARTPLVAPHPHVVEPALIQEPRSATTDFVVGVHVKSLRANMDPFPIIDTLINTIGDLGNAILRVNVHDEIFDPGNHFFAPVAGRRLLDYDQFPHVDVRVHRYFTDDELWQYLSELSVSVLPYRFGTHSGWLEACYDLGTAVVAPDCGYYGQQRECRVFGFNETTFDAASLDLAVRDLHDRFSAGIASARATWADRRTERVTLSRTHAALYERALS
jgi:hypothetical protein